jgi:hypothetical protein
MNLDQVGDVESAVLTCPPRGPELGRGEGKSQAAGITSVSWRPDRSSWRLSTAA